MTDVDGTQVKNSAGQDLEPIEIPVTFPTITVQANKSGFNYANVLTYTNKINSDVWQGFAIGTVRCAEYTASSFWEYGARFWSIQITLVVNPNGWNPIKLFDMGTMTSSDGYVPDECLEVKGLPITEPVPLNGAGQKLGAGLPLVELPFNCYSSTAFASII